MSGSAQGEHDGVGDGVSCRGPGDGRDCGRLGDRDGVDTGSVTGSARGERDGVGIGACCHGSSELAGSLVPGGGRD